MIATPPSREKILQLAQKLPASAQILVQLGELLMDINSGLEEIAQLLKRDSALSAHIIRISNSVAYGTMGGIASIDEAVCRVGYAEVYRLTGFAAAAQLGEQKLHIYGHDGIQLRDNTIVCALAAEALAKRAGLDARVAYTAALMRPTGKLVLDRLGKTSLPATDNFATSGRDDLLRWEMDHFGRTNAEVAAIVLEAWRFPPAVIEPLKRHYLTQVAAGTHARMTAIVNLASGITSDSGFSLPGETKYWEKTPEKFQAAGLYPDLMTECTDEAIQIFEQIRATL